MTNENAGKFLVAILMVAFVVFAASLFGAAMGALSGVIVGWFFDDTIRAAQIAIHIDPLQPWQIGMFVGWLGGFFRSNVSKKSD